jgi:hypothetical protein
MIEQPEDLPAVEPRFTRGVRTALLWCEESLYIIVGVLLLAAGVLVVVGTITGLISSIQTHQSRTKAPAMAAISRCSPTVGPVWDGRAPSSVVINHPRHGRLLSATSATFRRQSPARLARRRAAAGVADVYRHASRWPAILFQRAPIANRRPCDHDAL